MCSVLPYPQFSGDQKAKQQENEKNSTTSPANNVSISMAEYDELKKMKELMVCLHQNIIH